MLSKGYMSIRLFYLEVFAQLFRETITYPAQQRPVKPY